MNIGSLEKVLKITKTIPENILAQISEQV